MDNQFLKQFAEESLSQLKSLDPSEVKLFSSDEIPENYTLVVRPRAQDLQIIEKVIAELKLIEPYQYFYPLENLHLTLIGNLPKQIDSENFINVVKKILPEFNFKFELKGFGSNENCASFSAYPIDFSLHKFREDVRQSLGFTGDDYRSILESYEYVGWINFLRYLKKPSRDFLGALYKERDTAFGNFKPEIAQLYKNTSKVLNVKKTVLIHEFKIS